MSYLVKTVYVQPESNMGTIKTPPPLQSFSSIRFLRPQKCKNAKKLSMKVCLNDIHRKIISLTHCKNIYSSIDNR